MSSPRVPIPASAVLVVAATAAVTALVVVPGVRTDDSRPRPPANGGGPATAPAQSSPRPAGTPADLDLGTVRHPVRCGPGGVEVHGRVDTDLTGDGVPEAVVALRCRSSAGSPPSTVLVYGADPDASPASPRVLATLVTATDRLLVSGLSSARLGLLELRGLGYSSADVPRCCPDLTVSRSWQWRDGRLRRLR